jgi:hypothetical protein
MQGGGVKGYTHNTHTNACIHTQRDERFPPSQKRMIKIALWRTFQSPRWLSQLSKTLLTAFGLTLREEKMVVQGRVLIASTSLTASSCSQGLTLREERMVVQSAS